MNLTLHGSEQLAMPNESSRFRNLVNARNASRPSSTERSSIIPAIDLPPACLLPMMKGNNEKLWQMLLSLRLIYVPLWLPRILHGDRNVRFSRRFNSLSANWDHRVNCWSFSKISPAVDGKGTSNDPLPYFWRIFLFLCDGIRMVLK